MTRFSFYDHDATQSECAHRLSATSSWNVGGPFTFLCVISAGIIFARAPPFRLALPKSALPSPSSLTFIPTIFFTVWRLKKSIWLHHPLQYAPIRSLRSF